VPTLPEISARLLADGFRPGAPSRIAHEADSAIAEEADCDECGRRGLVYHAFTRQPKELSSPTTVYVAVAVCPACGAAEEF
jgi:hypothetical protein